MTPATGRWTRRALAAAWLLWAALFFSVPGVHGGQATPVNTEEAQTWAQYGINPEDAAEWKHVGFSPAEAREWVKAGIPYAQWADQWRGEGFSPAEAKGWVEEVNVYTAGDFRQFGFGNREALDWIGNGVRSGLRAKEFRDAGFTAAQAGLWWKHEFFPDESRAWRDAGFSVDEAVEWKYGKKQTHYMRGGVKSFSRQVYSVEWARQWRTAGFSSTEAKQCLNYNLGFDEAVRWSKAGFHLQEAFEWKDSGFGPEEAQEKKSSGLTPVEAEGERNEPGDEIVSFDSDVVLHSDSTLTVTETIEVRDRAGGLIQGCFKRVFPGSVTLRHSGNAFHTTAPSCRLLAVLKDGVSAPYTTAKDSGATKRSASAGKAARSGTGSTCLRSATQPTSGS